MNYEEFERLVITRRSVRKFAATEVPDELLNRALSLAVWAPNGGNKQAWGFYVVKNPAKIAAIADAVQAKTELMASWPEAASFGDVVARWRKTSDFFRRASVLIAVGMGNYESIADKILAQRGSEDKEAAAITAARTLGASRLQSVAAAINTLLLGLHLQGLASCWMAGPQQAKAEIEQIVEMSPDLDFIALIPVGFPGEEPRDCPRKPLADVVHYLR